jgi:hypothetical protein
MSQGGGRLKDTSREIKKIQFDLMLKMTPDERIARGCEMFMSARTNFLNSLPEDMSPEEKMRQLYFRTYGEHLPEDFFDR